MRHLEFDGRYTRAILEGKKRSTVRKGKKPNLNPGDEVLIHAGGYVIGRAVVERVECRRVQELTDDDAVSDGFSRREELLEALRRHYKSISDVDTVHIIRFRMVECFEKPVLSSDYAYEGNVPLTIAEMALKNLSLPERDRELIELFLQSGSLRKAAYRLGGPDKRREIREALRRAYLELKEAGLVKSRV
ncbi:ASCH domain-containing protein [Thermococcus sp.]|uniref:ASCH domain-containing protein n=1 Tax=Thermococcus sp. TaxID=35749 RepID=UPI00263483FE|nr:ASCH domain-containing protein [Thermococcus sp.]